MMGTVVGVVFTSMMASLAVPGLQSAGGDVPPEVCALLLQVAAAVSDAPSVEAWLRFVRRRLTIGS